MRVGFAPRLAVLACVLAIALFFPERADAAFGISPPFLNADHLVPGSRYVQTIYLVQDNPAQDLKINANFDLHERAKKWFLINNGSDIVIPKGTRQFPVEIVIQVPKNAEFAVYRGTLTFSGAPAGAGQVTIALGVEVAINLTIGKDIYRDYTVPLVRLLDIEEGWSPRVYVKFRNNGNVPEAFDGAVYELYDQFGAARLAYVQKRKNFPETPAFGIKEYVVEFPLDFHIGLGQYWAGVQFFKEEKLVASQRTVFNVLKRGSLSNPLTQLWNFFKEHTYQGGGIALIALAILFAYVRRRRRMRVRHA